MYEFALVPLLLLLRGDGISADLLRGYGISVEGVKGSTGPIAR
jgi:hypothetical protein